MIMQVQLMQVILVGESNFGITIPLKYNGPLTYELNSFARAGCNSSWS